MLRTFWAVVPSEKTISSTSSQYGDERGCLCNLYCKFEMNLRLFVIWQAGDDEIVALINAN